MENENGLTSGWQERIKGKKVILYNTSVSSMLSGNHLHIQKMNKVFDTFKRQKDVILWWRPHPLESSTIESMRPELLEMYKQLRRKFLEEDIGILDESVDLNRAIAISDAYYGDFSSIIHLYTAVGKPVLIASDSVQKTDSCNELFLWIIDYCIIDTVMYCISAYSNIVYQINIKTLEVEDIIEFGGEYPKRNVLFSSIMAVDGKLVIMPDTGNHIIFYDIENKKADYRKYGINHTNKRFEYFHSDKDDVLFMQRVKGGTVRIDVKKSEIISKSDKVSINLTKFCRDNDTIYSTELSGNKIYEIDMEKGEANLIYTGQGSDCFCEAAKIGNILVIPHQSSQPRITLWNRESCKRRDIVDFPQDFRCFSRYPYAFMIAYLGNVYLFPYQSNMILKIDVENNSVSCFKKFDYDKTTVELGIYLQCVRQRENKVYAFNTRTNAWDAINFDTGEISSYPVKISEKLKDYIIGRSIFNIDDTINKNESFYDTEFYCNTLGDYIKAVSRLCKKEDSFLENSSIGYKIHEKIKQNC